jgi:phosphate butyryltransferase
VERDHVSRGQSWREFTVFHPVLEKARGSTAQRLCVVAPDDDVDNLGAIRESMDLGLVHHPILIGDRDKMIPTLEAARIDRGDVEIISCPDWSEAANRGAHLVGHGEADLLAKGRVPTAELLRAVLRSSNGLRRTGEGEDKRLVSHLALFDVESVPRIVGLTDAGVNIAPDYEAVRDIVRNAAEVFRLLLGRTPRVAMLAAVEKVNESMPATVVARRIQEAAERGELGDAVVEGPLSLDCAIDERAARGKGVAGEVAGRADIVVTPDIQAGNITAKSIMYFARGIMAGILAGTRAPVIVNSRVDVPAARVASILCAVVLAQRGSS